MLFRFLLVFAFVLCNKWLVAQSNYNCNQVLQFKKLLDEHHVSPLVWDDAFAAKVTDRFFKLVDPKGLLFSKDEVSLFLDQSKKLDNALLAGDCSVISELTPLYSRALIRAERLLQELTKTPINFDEKDTLIFNYAHNEFVSKEAELKKRWLQWVKFSVLNEIATNDIQASQIKSTYKPVADKVFKKYLNIIKRKKEIAGGIESFLFVKLMNAIASSYDPHTEFYPASEKQSFQDRLTTDAYSFGFLLEDDPMGNVTIRRIIPGSAAWDMKRLNEGDVVISIKSAHMEKMDASLYNSEELEEALASISHEVELSVRKADGEVIMVKLLKQKIREDNNKIKSLVFSNENDKFGYVSLPIFFEKDSISNSGCAGELAKEIIHLKQAKIKGLILDIRNNGGGDLYEALDLAGIFIDRGALAIMQRRGEEAVTLKDSNLGTAYDGPLVVMINSASASASELFATAMRDHNRAILVGGTTYGKGTGQSVMFFNSTKREMVKITSFRFYGVKGMSHQGGGLVPDIILPDMLSEFDYHESQQQYALTADRIQKKTYYTPLAPLPLDLLRDSSQQRINKTVFFLELEKQKNRTTKLRNGMEVKIPLIVIDFLSIKKNNGTHLEALAPVSDYYKINLTKFDQQVTVVDSFGQETFKELINDVSHDFYIAEALHVLKNYIDLKK